MSTWNRCHFDLRQELVGLAAARLVRALARHLHVAAERQRADPVFRVAAPEAEDGRIEAELELQDLDADALGRQEMAELVHEDEHAEHERERENVITVEPGSVRLSS